MKGSSMLMKLRRILLASILMITPLLFTTELETTPELTAQVTETKLLFASTPETVDQNSNILDPYDMYKLLNHLSQKYSFVAAGLHARAQQYIADETKKDAIKKWAQKIQEQAVQIQKNVLANAPASTFKQYLTYLDKLNDALLTAISSNFSQLDIPSLEILEGARHSGLIFDQTFNEFFSKNYHQLEESVITISQKTTSLGVSKLHKVARKIDELNKKYYLGYSASVVASMVAGYYILNWMLPTQTELTPEARKTFSAMLEEIKKNPTGENNKSQLTTISETLKGDNQTRFSNRLAHFLKMTTVGIASTATSEIVGKNLAFITSPIKDGWKFTTDKTSKLWKKAQGLPEKDEELYRVVTGIDLESDRLIGLEIQKRQLLSAIDRGVTGILLYGPSRCGKTLLAEALAGTLEKQLRENGSSQQVFFSEIPQKWLNWGYLKGVIEDAQQKNGTVILFIDEIHNLNLQTTKDTQTLTDFLVAMNKLANATNPNNKVILIGATNRAELLDPALLSWGRFTETIQFEKPTAATRHHFFTQRIKSLGILPTNDSLNIGSLVRQTNDVSYGDLEAIVTEAVKRANGSLPTQEHFQVALDSRIHRFTGTRSDIQEQDLVVVTHIAGLAVAHTLLNPLAQLERISIGQILAEIEEENDFTGDKKRSNPNKAKPTVFGGIVTYNPHAYKIAATKKDVEKEIKILLAGFIAQELMLGSSSSEYRIEDQRTALLLAQKMILNGTKFEDLSKQRQEKIKQDAEAYIINATEDVRTLLKKNEKELLMTVELLDGMTTIPGDIMNLIIKCEGDPKKLQEFFESAQQKVEETPTLETAQA